MTFLEPARFLWLMLLPALAAAALFAGLRHRRNLHRFATPERLNLTLPTRSRARRVGRAVLVLLCLGLTLVALADPRRGERERDVPPGDGVSVVFALDVSRSMLARDVSPTRLDRAKQYVRELTRVLAEREDDVSVGLVAFAGAVKRVTPVTRNFGEVELALQATDVTTAGVGGSNLADAVQASARSFVARRPGHKVVVMLTDGEENLSGEPAAAARTAFEGRGVRFFPLGLGSPDTGATIPLGEGRVMMHDGEPVQTTLDADALKAIAEGGGGVYLPGETKRVDMDEVYRRVIRPRLRAADADAATPGANTVKAMIPRFGWLVWPALALLLAERLIAAWPARRRAGMATTALLIVCSLPAAAQDIEPDPRSAYNAAVAAQAAGDADGARAGFAEAALRGVGEVESRARYNLGRAAHTRALEAIGEGPGVQAEIEAAAPGGAPPPRDTADAAGPGADPIQLLDEAVREYAAALGADPAFDDARANLEVAARLRAQLQQQQQEQDQQQEQPPDENPSESDPSEDGEPQDGSPESQEQESSEGQEQDSSEDQEQESQPSESGESSEGDPESSEADPNADPESESGTDSETVSESEAEATNEPSDTTAGSENPEAASETEPASEGEPAGAEGESETGDSADEQAVAGTPGEAGEQALNADEAMKLLQRIRDQDLQRRIEQYRRDARRQQRVEKDW